MRFGIILCLLSGVAYLSAQAPQSKGLDSLRTEVEQVLAAPGDTAGYALPGLLPGSWRLRDARGQTLPDSLLDWREGRLFLKAQAWQAGDSLKLSYRRFSELSPLGGSAYRLKDPRMAQGLPATERLAGQRYVYKPFEQQGLGGMSTEGLNYTGSFSRGISLGNRQDLLLNSQFNLQLGGRIGEVEISGAITDNNVPLQPDGNTQQLRDFDRVFLQFKLKEHRLIAGDYDLQNPNYTYFLPYKRRLQGLQLDSRWTTAKKAKVQLGASAAFSRGKFARQSFLGQEGNQGPYRLQGANNEPFIIILAGTERVFIDGELLVRGSDRDYIMDYNLGEITFTNRQLITKDKRIVVEFSYNDLNYLRSLLTHNLRYEQPDKGRALFFQWYSERDARNQPVDGPLPDSLQRLLSQAGDSPNGALRSGAQALNPSLRPGERPNILYILRDTLVGAQRYDSIWVYEPRADTGLYQVRFSLVGEGQGDYRRRLDNTNGAIYDWVAPDPQTGRSRGNYAPVLRLVPPQSRSMYVFGAEQRLGQAQLSGQIALSQTDLNTFSKLDGEDNWGGASRLDYRQRLRLSDSTESRFWTLQLDGHYEAVQPNFELVEPYRAREFARDWTVGQTEADSLARPWEHWLGLGLQLREARQGQLRYEAQYLHRGETYQGWRQNLGAQWQYKGWRLDGQSAWVSSQQGQDQSTSFARPKADLSYTLPLKQKLRLGLYYEEENQASRQNGDSLNNRSFRYQVYKGYAELPNTAKNLRLEAQVLRRYDYAPQEGLLRLTTIADEARFGGEWQSKKAGRLHWNIHYRQLQIADSSLSTERPEDTYLGRLEYSGQYGKGFVKWNTIYELGTGQQQRMEYNYIRVDRGLGTHVWIDRNDDGVQQQVEFEQAPFADQADFMRVLALSGTFVRSDNVVFNQSLDILPAVLFRRSSKESKASRWAWLGKLAWRSQWRIERKTLAGADVLPFNPFDFVVADSSLVSLQNQWRNNFFLNRSNPNWGLELGHRRLDNKNTLVNGSEARQQEEFSFKGRLKLGKRLLAEAETQIGSNGYESLIFAERNYQLRELSWQPSLIWQWESLWRLQGFFKSQDRRNRIGALEQGLSREIGLEGTYSRSSGMMLRFKLSTVNLIYQGPENTPVQFILTQGLQPGRNYLWTFSLEKALSNNMQLSFSYEGRKTGELPLVHVGRAQVRAMF